MSRARGYAAGMITYEQRTQFNSPHLSQYTFFSESENWFIEIRETESPSLSWPILHNWMVVFDEGVVCEGSIGTLEDAKRYAEIAYEAFRTHLGS